MASTFTTAENVNITGTFGKKINVLREVKL